MTKAPEDSAPPAPPAPASNSDARQNKKPDQEGYVPRARSNEQPEPKAVSNQRPRNRRDKKPAKEKDDRRPRRESPHLNAQPPRTNSRNQQRHESPHVNAAVN